MVAPAVISVTPRQHDAVKALLHDGADNATIGRRIGVKPGTVQDHIKAVLKTSELANRTELVVEILSGRRVLKIVDRRDPLK